MNLSNALTEDAKTRIQNWKNNNCAAKVLSKGGVLDDSELWTSELLEFLISIHESMENVKLYYYKHVILEDESDIIVLYKTREFQGLPSVGDRVIRIMEGIRGGKVRFTCEENIFLSSLQSIDFDTLVWINNRIPFEESNSIMCKLFRFIKSVPNGTSGYESIKILLGLQSWRDVFKVLVEHKVFGDTVGYAWEKYDNLPYVLLINPKCLRVLALHFKVPIMILKDDDSFENYTMVDTGIAGNKPDRILCLHVQGDMFSPLEPNRDGFERLLKIYSEERSRQIRNVEIHKV